MPSGAKKRKAAKKKKELQGKDQSNSAPHSRGEEDLKHDVDKVNDGKLEDGSENLHITIEHVESGREPPKKGLRRSSSSSSSSSSSNSSSSEEKSAVVHENSIAVDNTPAVELVKETDSFANDQVIENFPGTEDKAAQFEDMVYLTTSSSNTDNLISHTVEPAKKENLEEKLGFVDEKATVSEVLVELEKRIDEASAALHDGAVAASDAKAFAVKEDEDNLELSYNAPTVDVNVHPDNEKDTPTRECYEHQPSVALAPRPAQTTSWKSCCGLFEVLARSNGELQKNA